MIKLENVVLASPEQMDFIIEGMRNPMNSWDRSDSYIDAPNKNCNGQSGDSFYVLGGEDHNLMQRLANAGTDRRNFMRMMPVYVRITAPLYWWKDFDDLPAAYTIGVISDNSNVIDKIAEKEFTIEDFSTDKLLSFSGNHNDEREVPTVMIDEHNQYSPKGILECAVIPMLNDCRNLYLGGVNHGVMVKTRKDKDIWWQMIQLLPSSYNQTRNVMMNYEVLANIYQWRKDHKLDEWREFCKWIEGLPYSELITGLPIESDDTDED